MAVIHTHDWQRDLWMRDRNELRGHLARAHGMPDIPLEQVTADHDELHDRAPAVPPEAGLYERISLEFSGSWTWCLRFGAPGGAVTMVRVNAADRAVLAALLRKEKP
jgi:hypothetical protein